MNRLELGARPKEDERDELLTEIFGRRVLERDADEWLRALQPRNLPLGCLALDLDGFKAINDTYGHAKGDEALQLVAGELRLISSGKGRVHRKGGDEFIVLLPNHTGEEARAVGERMRRAVATIEIPDVSLRLGVTIGVACLPPHAETFHELMDRADAVLIKAKRAGKDMVRVYFGETTSVQEGGFPSFAYLVSSNRDIRGDAVAEFKDWMRGKRETPTEQELSALDELLTDPDIDLRREACEIVGKIIDRIKESRDIWGRHRFGSEEIGEDVARRYKGRLIELAERDRPSVRARAVDVIGRTGSSEFVDELMRWVCSWDDASYEDNAPNRALSSLAKDNATLRDLIRSAVRRELERQTSPAILGRLKQCLAAI